MKLIVGFMRLGTFLLILLPGFVLIKLYCFPFMESVSSLRIFIGWTGIIVWLGVSYFLAKNVTLPGRK